MFVDQWDAFEALPSTIALQIRFSRCEFICRYANDPLFRFAVFFADVNLFAVILTIHCSASPSFAGVNFRFGTIT